MSNRNNGRYRRQPGPPMPPNAAVYYRPPPRVAVLPNLPSGPVVSAVSRFSNVPAPPPRTPLTQLNFKPLPFFDCQSILMKPLYLDQNGDSSFCSSSLPTNTFNLAVGLEDINKLKPKTQECAQFKLHLRICCPDRGLKLQLDNLPGHIIVNLDGHNVDVPLPLPAPPGSFPVRPKVPIDLTECFNARLRLHKLQISWKNVPENLYAISVLLVRVNTTDALLSELLSVTWPVEEERFTKRLIRNQLTRDDSDIATTSLRISLICPLSKLRLKMPIRAESCHHVQCFDAEIYLSMNEKKSTWMCPVCNRSAEYRSLRLNKFMQNVLSSVGDDVAEVDVQQDGVWSAVSRKNEDSNVELQSSTKTGKPCEVVLLDDSDMCDSSESSGSSDGDLAAGPSTMEHDGHLDRELIPPDPVSPKIVSPKKSKTRGKRKGRSERSNYQVASTSSEETTNSLTAVSEYLRAAAMNGVQESEADSVDLIEYLRRLADCDDSLTKRIVSQLSQSQQPLVSVPRVCDTQPPQMIDLIDSDTESEHESNDAIHAIPVLSTGHHDGSSTRSRSSNSENSSTGQLSSGSSVVQSVGASIEPGFSKSSDVVAAVPSLLPQDYISDDLPTPMSVSPATNAITYADYNDSDDDDLEVVFDGAVQSMPPQLAAQCHVERSPPPPPPPANKDRASSEMNGAGVSNLAVSTPASGGRPKRTAASVAMAAITKGFEVDDLISSSDQSPDSESMPVERSEANTRQPLPLNSVQFKFQPVQSRPIEQNTTNHRITSALAKYARHRNVNAVGGRFDSKDVLSRINQRNSLIESSRVQHQRKTGDIKKYLNIMNVNNVVNQQAVSATGVREIQHHPTMVQSMQQKDPRLAPKTASVPTSASSRLYNANVGPYGMSRESKNFMTGVSESMFHTMASQSHAASTSGRWQPQPIPLLPGLVSVKRKLPPQQQQQQQQAGSVSQPKQPLSDMDAYLSSII